jgi:hypothetical protein
MRLHAARTQNKLACVLLLVSSLPLKGTLPFGADLTAEIGSRYESNVSNSDRPSDRLADGFFMANVGLGKSGVWGRDWRWQVALSGEGEVAFRFIELSEIEGGVRLGVARKFGLGWNAPRLQFEVYPAFRGLGSLEPPASD